MKSFFARGLKLREEMEISSSFSIRLELRDFLLLHANFVLACKTKTDRDSHTQNELKEVHERLRGCLCQKKFKRDPSQIHGRRIQIANCFLPSFFLLSQREYICMRSRHDDEDEKNISEEGREPFLLVCQD